MTQRTRLFLAAASLALLCVYVLPLWNIDLDAPQYPEGLGMVIEVNTIRGQQEGNLESINGLNHYIGMKEIEPDAIPELEVMPWLFAALIAFGLLGAWTGKRWMLYTWLGAFALIMAGALVDFYLWGYDYGHNLDVERAIIKVPGMTYQPPVIGTKQMLNITASSWPAVGGWIAFGAFVLAALGAVLDWRQRGTAETGSRRAALASFVLPVVLTTSLISLGGCAPSGSQPIHYGEDHCDYCRMSISDSRFAAEVVTTTGKVYTFDSVECLGGFVKEERVPREQLKGVYVTDFRSPETLIPVEDAFFLHSPNLRSPMGMNLTAFGDQIRREAVLDSFPGDLLAWNDVLSLVEKEWLQDSAGVDAHPAGRVE